MGAPLPSWGPEQCSLAATLRTIAAARLDWPLPNMPIGSIIPGRLHNQATKGNAMAWVMLVIAGLLEMVWSYSAKRSDGFSNWGWGAVTIAASLVSFFLLTFAMRGLQLGTAYAVWTGIGTVGTFAVGIALLGEPAGFWRIACAMLIVGGVIGLRLTSKS
jgi:quaternary ammonium compound-resistance protein SugE